MGSEIVALDLERARALGVSCADVSGAAGRLANDVNSLLAAARQSNRAAVLLDEVEQELALLHSVIAATSDQIERADTWNPTDFFDTRGLGDRFVTLLYDRALWSSLDDKVGATALRAGGFDLAGSFRTLSEAGWRAAMTPPGCESFGPGRYYTGGGALLGADRRSYPIVVAHWVLGADRHFTLDADNTGSMPTVASLGGADPGWTLVDYRTGVERIESDPGLGLKLLTGAAVASGLDLGSGVDDGNLVGVHMRPGWRARFAAAPWSTSAAVVSEVAGGSALTRSEPTVWLTIDGRTAEYPISEVPDLGLDGHQLAGVPSADRTARGRLNLADQVLSLVTGVAAGFVAGRDLGNGRYRAYEVYFEEHADGRRRSRVQSFTLEQGPQGVQLYAWHLFLDPDGNLQESPVSYQLGESVQSPDMLLAHNPYDPDFTTRLPSAAFGAADPAGTG